MVNKYKEGEVVYERIHPLHKLIISRFCNGIYYAKVVGNESRELVFLEIEIKGIPISENPRLENRTKGRFSFQFFSFRFIE